MKVIGLTGGIGAGKSTVSSLLREKGFLIIDADEISHRITEKGSALLEEIVGVFGRDILLSDGSLNRQKLAAMVFSDERKLKVLESLTTRRVLTIMEEQLCRLRQEAQYAIIFIDVPLLYETGADRLADLVWLISADPEVRISRVMERDGASREEVCRRMNSQMDEAEKKRRADVIIDNSGGKEELCRQVEQLLMKYVESQKRE